MQCDSVDDLGKGDAIAGEICKCCTERCQGIRK